MYVVKSKPFFSFHYMPMRQKVCLKGLKTSLVSDNDNDICTREKNWEVYLAQVHWKVTKYLWHFREKKINCEFCMNLSWFKNVSFKGHLALVVLGKNTYIHGMKNFQNAHFSNIQSIKSWPLSEKKKKIHQ